MRKFLLLFFFTLVLLKCNIHQDQTSDLNQLNTETPLDNANRDSASISRSFNEVMGFINYEPIADSIEKIWEDKLINNDTDKVFFILDRIQEKLLLQIQRAENPSSQITSMQAVINPEIIILERIAMDQSELLKWFIDSSSVSSEMKQIILRSSQKSNHIFSELELIDHAKSYYLNDSTLFLHTIIQLIEQGESNTFEYFSSELENDLDIRYHELFKAVLYQIEERIDSSSLSDSINVYLDGFEPSWIRAAKRSDSIGQIQLDSFHARQERKRIAYLDSMELVFRDSSNWTQRQKDLARRYGDTTIPVSWVGMDYSRFTDYNNSQLIHYLDTVDMDYVYKSDTGALNPRSRSYNFNPRVIHLRKVVQIIGDRYLNGTLQLTEQEQMILDYTIEKYVNYFFEPRIEVHHPTQNISFNALSQTSREAKDQLLRLWTLPLPYYFDWIDDTSSSGDVIQTGRELISTMAHDSIIMKVIKRAVQADSNSVKNDYISLLLELGNNSGTEKWLKDNREMPRRPYYSDSQVLDWKTRMIEPGIIIIQDTRGIR